MRLLAQLRRNTWGLGPLTHVCGAVRRGPLLDETADDIMVTCSTEGVASVWEMKDHSFQVLCLLRHLDDNEQVVKVNVAAAIVLDPSTDSPNDETRFRVITGGDDGCTRLWCFDRDTGVDFKQWRPFADSESELYGIPQKAAADHFVFHECDQCMHHHAVLSLAVLPQKWAGQSDSVAFNFICGTTAGYASVYTVSEAGQKPEIKELECSKILMHEKSTVVNQVTASVDFLRTTNSDSVLVATCGGRGLAKLWRLSAFKDDTCDVSLIKVCSHIEEGSPVVLTFASFTPAWEEGAKRYFITSSFDDFRHERSRVFAWDLSVEGDQELKDARTYVFRANNFCFWYPRSVDQAHGMHPYVYCLTSAPDSSAKMFRLVNMTTGQLTEPLLRDKIDAKYEDPAEIDHCFVHHGPVKWVSTVRMKETALHKVKTVPDSYAPLNGMMSSEGWYFVTGGLDQVANLWDPPSRQCIHALRAATMTEMYLPLLLQILTALQLISFSFMNDIKWNHETAAPARGVANIVTIHPNNIARIFPMSIGEASLLFMAMCVFAVLVFDVIILWDVINGESRLMLQLEISPSFRAEVKQGWTGLRGKPMGPIHRHLDRVGKRRTLYRNVIYMGSTVMVVPIVKTLSHFFECTEVDGQVRLMIAVDVEWLSCEQIGFRLMQPVVLLVLLSYIFLALPYIVVKGDARVVARRDIFSVDRWRRNAEQKAGLVHLGVMRVHPEAYFGEKLLEMCVKILVPVLSTLLTPPLHFPGQRAEVPLEDQEVIIIRVFLITLLHAVVVYQAFSRQLYATRSINALFTAMKMFGLWSGICSCITAWIDDDQIWWPAVLWYGGLVIIVVVGLVIYQKRSAEELDKDKEEEDMIMKPGAKYKAG